MTDTPETLSGTECNGDRPPENGQQPSSQTRQETTDADETQAYYKVEPSLEDLPAKENQEETGNTKGNILPKGPEDEKILNENPEENLFVVHQAIKDLSLQEISAEDMAFREGRIRIQGKNVANLSSPSQLSQVASASHLKGKPI
ncbi:ermin isoform X2 [Mus musculus]|uniref:ermin isoform X2 n=1 Tax=Mus musculus TaxID=10090 RepID=UPI0016733E5C|nr:ermin isoform X2 [Mus musculus]XP_036018612.1 ermin isoform X2 [Mus musculus]